MTGVILTINAGSSSLKFALYDQASLKTAAHGAIESLDAAPHLLARDGAGAVLAEQRWAGAIADPFETALEAMMVFAETQTRAGALAAVGHRVVHGGALHVAPELATPALLASLDQLTPLARLHMPHNLAPVRALAASRPDLPQVLCFDTAFHRTVPKLAQSFAVPRVVSEAGVRRYGFHGLSYEYIASRLPSVSPRMAGGRVIAAHLGAGASLCALLAGVSIETTMGFSALDGLMMATRCGSIDPGVLLYLGQQGHSFEDIETMLYSKSGLLGVSGISGDVRVLLASADPRAAEALELFSYRIAQSAGALASALGGVDGIVFTAGIGEHAPQVREAACARLAWLGVTLDEAANAAGAPLISTADSKVEVRIIPTDEEAMIAHHTRDVLQGIRA